jgi:hypothetical protein
LDRRFSSRGRKRFRRHSCSCELQLARDRASANSS